MSYQDFLVLLRDALSEESKYVYTAVGEVRDGDWHRAQVEVLIPVGITGEWNFDYPEYDILVLTRSGLH